MYLALLFVACLVAQGGQVVPQSQQRPPETVQSTPADLGADTVSLERIRRGVERTGTRLDLRGVSSSEFVPTFRIEVLSRRPMTMQEAIQEFLAEPAEKATPGFLDQYPGPRRAGAGDVPLIGGSVYVDPLFMVHWPQRWAQRRAAAKAKEEVEAELRALVAAQKDGAR